MLKDKKQLTVFMALLGLYAVLAFVTYTFFSNQFTPPPDNGSAVSRLAPWQLGLINAGVIFFLYGLLGWGGYWVAHKLGLPGVFSPDGNWRRWVVIPLLYGLALGVIVIAGDQLISRLAGTPEFSHPSFPLSIIASVTAGIGEEIAFRMFVLGLWAFLLNLLLKHWHATKLALWLGNLIAALIFAAGHLSSAAYLLGAASPAQIPTPVLVEIFLLNGIVGLVAGERYMRDGLVAAAGVHFWTDIVWHVVWPLLGL
jgi:membrane protease YdiL (CAAX protease family)